MDSLFESCFKTILVFVVNAVYSECVIVDVRLFYEGDTVATETIN